MPIRPTNRGCTTSGWHSSRSSYTLAAPRGPPTYPWVIPWGRRTCRCPNSRRPWRHPSPGLPRRRASPRRYRRLPRRRRSPSLMSLVPSRHQLAPPRLASSMPSVRSPVLSLRPAISVRHRAPSPRPAVSVRLRVLSSRPSRAKLRPVTVRTSLSQARTSLRKSAHRPVEQRSHHRRPVAGHCHHGPVRWPPVRRVCPSLRQPDHHKGPPPEPKLTRTRSRVSWHLMPNPTTINPERPAPVRR